MTTIDLDDAAFIVTSQITFRGMQGRPGIVYLLGDAEYAAVEITAREGVRDNVRQTQYEHGGIGNFMDRIFADPRTVGIATESSMAVSLLSGRGYFNRDRDEGPQYYVRNGKRYEFFELSR